MMKKILGNTPYCQRVWSLFLCPLFLLLVMACTDELGIPDTVDGDDGIQFVLNVSDLGNEQISMGSQTRAPMDAFYRHADDFIVHQLEGDNPDGLTIHRMPIPYVGIHQRTIPSTADPASADDASTSTVPTRSSLSEIATQTVFHDSLTIWGYTDTGITLFNGGLLTRIHNYRSSVQWPYEHGAVSSMKFYAVAPGIESMNMMTSGTPTISTPPTLTYTLPELASEMRDLLWGESEMIDVQKGPDGSTTSDPKQENLGKDNKHVALNFRHITTAVRFAQGNIPAAITVRRISILNVNTKGTYHSALFDAATATTGTWSDLDTPGTYSISPSFVGTGTANTYIDNDSVLFMIPHVITEAARLQVLIEVGGKLHTLSCSLTGDVWKKGYTVTYKLTIGEVENGYYFVADAPAAHEHSNSPIVGTFNVHSYHKYHDYSTDTDNTTHAVNWAVEGYYSDELCTVPVSPSWLSVYGTNSGTPSEYVGGSNATGSYLLSAQSFTKSGNHATILAGNTDYGSSLTLSTHSPNNNSFSEQTANCYIVNRRGSYDFPLVYGNKTADGPESAGFVDHKGAVIKFRKIEDQIKAKNPDDGVYESIDGTHRKRTEYTWKAATGTPDRTLRPMVVWQDVNKLIDASDPANLSVTSEEMSFKISSSTPGNAVIALQARTLTTYEVYISSAWKVDTSKGTGGYEYGEWETLWTWHIWMTDEVYANTLKDDAKYYDSYFLNYNYTGDHENRNHLVSLGNYADAVNSILPVNLGWVPDDNNFGYYDHREVWVKLQQVEGVTPLTSVIKIEQHARQPLITGTSTVYQWGRPTALPMVLKGNGTARTIYDGLGNDITDQFTLENIANAGDPISRATKLLRRPTSGNAWFDTSSSIPIYWSDSKTVYDPCPPGFHVPATTVFTGLSRTGVKAVDGMGLNIYEDVGGQKSASMNAGGYFYTSKYVDASSPSRYSNMVYFPVTREWQGDEAVGTAMTALNANHTFGFYWCNDIGGSPSRVYGPVLWLCPEWSYEGTSSAPAFQTGPNIKYSSAQPIRPTGTLLAY